MVKICGITSADDARCAIEAGADALGFNFSPASARYVTLDEARSIVESLSADVPRAGITRVGVFVNAPADVIRSAAKLLGLDLVQLHGDEPPATMVELADLGVIRAFRVGDKLAPVASYLDRCAALGALPRVVLVDSYQANAYGGTGKTAPWELLAARADELHGLPLILAGGLRPTNVRQAIQQVRPDAVDVASGVESAPGRKDATLCRQFVAEARLGFQEAI